MCSEFCSYCKTSFEETGYYYLEKDIAETMAQILGCVVDDRPSGFYLIRETGLKCTRQCSEYYNQFVNQETDCNFTCKDVCDGQLSLSDVF